MMKERTTVYYETAGSDCTRKTLERCVERLLNWDLSTVESESPTLIIPSTTGRSALLALDLLSAHPQIHLIVVGHRYGFREAGKNEIPDETQKKIRDRGYGLFFGTHLFTGLEKAVSNAYGGAYPHRLIADTLRIFSPGTKVLFEDTVMATDAGLVAPNRWVVAAGGTGRGLDTAMVIKSAHSDLFFQIRIREILCLPEGAL
ncbi:MAG TPA: pyruvate kinase alpha/beta domain-containing protein [Thermotogota bacterium]|jgi:hypothetical protein|nr:hypothetical protein [Thermotogaceae bacterium]OQC31409.1 MAG: Pyruvate kinase, alpha/beta domain [Thermotogota bacterium ADurb.Bin062]HNW46432.1 pyruvate kinase alpha/beta domain-containing protein [Thermotogota bacterium]HNY82989.1 pyruvate kinase alpha/beta domain-containing protein [Thermotogota bacterium]HOD91147.1 pyruvate kinase alpha/beta domain-containing protein [Thermotogota bacterium]